MNARLHFAAMLAFAFASPAAATTYTMTFDALAPGTSFIDLEVLLDSNNTEALRGGLVAVPGVDAPAHFTPRSGAQVYVGTDIEFVMRDPVCCSWEGVGAYVTGEDVVTATAYAWNYGTEAFEFMESRSTPGRNVEGSGLAPNFKLELGTFDEQPALIVLVQFRSALPFALDDVYYGGTAGIPEPASWALLLAGFGLVGFSVRRSGGLIA